jgi:hypothetical protein
MSEDLLHREISQSALRALLYYDIFNYPLTSGEVFTNLSTNHITPVEIKETLLALVKQECIFNWDGFFTVQNNPQLIERRKEGNKKALDFLPIARRKARLIHSFPFVRSVMASGSLSKNYMDDKSDLDFFVITEPNRLWIARMLLVLYKRIFLFNSHKHFCINYLIDSNHLEIEEKNIFTAMELATLIPLCDSKFYSELFNKNQWLNQFLPNHQQHSESAFVFRQQFFKKNLEKMIELIGADRLDIFFMNLTQKRWDKIYKKKYSSSDFQIAFKTKRYASKNHPRHYQKKVADLYKERLAAFAHKFKIHWLHE